MTPAASLRALGYDVDVYQPDEGPTVYAVRGFGVAISFGDDQAAAHFAALLAPKAHAARKLQHERSNSPRELPLDG